MKLDPLWKFCLAKERGVQTRLPAIADGCAYQFFHYDKKGFDEIVLIAFELETGVSAPPRTSG